MKILLVDDSSFKRKALAYLIGGQGHEVMEAGDGQDGIEKARVYMPDIIVSDILMPRMDGFQFLRNIKKDEQLRAIPFVFYSAVYTGEKEKELALSLGVSGFIEDTDKPERFWQGLQEIIGSGRCKEAQVCKPVIVEDEEFLKNYGHIVAAKLEEKVRELEEEINKKRWLEEALHESEAKFSTAFFSSPSAMGIATLEGKFVEVNRAYCDLVGYSREEIIGKTSVELGLLSAQEREKIVAYIKSVGGAVRFTELKLRARDGSLRYIIYSVETIYLSGIPHRIATGFDITERKRGEEALILLYNLIQDISLADDFSAALEVSLRKICVATGWVMGEAWIPAPDGSHLECSPAWYGGIEGLEKFRKISEGFSFQPGIGLPGHSWSSKKPVWDRDVTLGSDFKRATYAREAGLKAALAIPIISGDEVVAVMDYFVLETKEEDSRFVDLVSTVAAYLGVLFQRKQIEGEMRKLSLAVERSLVSVIITDAEGKIEYVNPKFIETTGYTREDMIGERPAILKSGEAIISDKEWQGEFLNRKKNGETFWEYSIMAPIINSEGVVSSYIVVNEDISQRKKAEEDRARLEAQLIQSQKMDAVGRLAGGIAHDFNNMLTAILGFSHLLLMKRGEDSLTKNYVKQIIAAGQSAANMVQSILSFSRKQTMFPKPLDINELVKHFQKTLLRLIREDIELKTVLKDTPLIVKADHTHIEQVLMNLSTNARDAMPHGGIITIATETVNIDNEFVSAHGYGVPGSYALLSFADTGIGMDEDTKKRVFEPFFTTKEVGKGTGLGLAMVYGIIKQHNGFINIYSEPGKGTTFRVYLPLVESAAEAEDVKEQALPAGRGETILLVEDNEIVRKLALAVLENSGYNVIVAVNGEDGVNKFTENRDAVRLCVCDMVMPKKGGREVYKEMKKIRPDIKVIFISGYAADEIKGALENGMDFISKPFSPSDFLRKVREVIDRQPHSSK